MLGHPKGEKGNKPDENHVSRTSSSYLRVILDLSTPNFFSALSYASSTDLATTQSSSFLMSGILSEPSILTR